MDVKKNRELIDPNTISSIPNEYSKELVEFAKKNKIKLPNINTMRGKVIALLYTVDPDKYCNRDVCDKICKKFDIKTQDSIQLFNKIDQIGIRCSEERGKYYIVKPCQLTNKVSMRKNFKYDGTEESRNNEINNIKAHLISRYLDVPNNKWQIGHKNPDIEDNSSNNLVLQPPIQCSYRDNYIFIDTFTKIPTPKKFKQMIKDGKCMYSKEQLKELKNIFNSLEL